MIIWLSYWNKKGNPFEYGIIPEIKFYHADIIDYDWTNSDFILTNSTCFDPDLMTKIYEKSKTWKEGTWFLTLTKKLPANDEWELIFQTKKQMSWAPATINLYRRNKIGLH